MVLHWLPTSNNYRMSISTSATPTYFTQICAIWICQPKLCPKNRVVSYLTQNPSVLYGAVCVCVCFPQIPFFPKFDTHPKKKMLDISTWHPETAHPTKRHGFHPLNFAPEKPRWLAVGEVSMPSLVTTPVSTTFKGLDISSSLSPNLGGNLKKVTNDVLFFGEAHPFVYIYI